MASWAKVDLPNKQMVFAEATLLVPLLFRYANHLDDWNGWARTPMEPIPRTCPRAG